MTTLADLKQMPALHSLPFSRTIRTLVHFVAHRDTDLADAARHSFDPASEFGLLLMASLKAEVIIEGRLGGDERDAEIVRLCWGGIPFGFISVVPSDEDADERPMLPARMLSRQITNDVIDILRRALSPGTDMRESALHEDAAELLNFGSFSRVDLETGKIIPIDADRVLSTNGSGVTEHRIGIRSVLFLRETGDYVLAREEEEDLVGISAEEARRAMVEFLDRMSALTIEKKVHSLILHCWDEGEKKTRLGRSIGLSADLRGDGMNCNCSEGHGNVETVCRGDAAPVRFRELVVDLIEGRIPLQPSAPATFK